MLIRSLRFNTVNQLAWSLFLTVFSLIITLAFPRAGSCTAGNRNAGAPPKKVTANQTPEAPIPAILLAQSESPDSETLEILKARKAALDQERAQIEKELAGIIRVGLQQQDTSTKRAKRAICKVNQDLEAMTKRIAAHQQKRAAFESDWDQYYAHLKDSEEVQRLKERKRAIEWDRIQVEEKLSELVRRHDQQIDQQEEIQWYQVALKEIDERLVGYRQNRDAFERDWEAFYSNK